MADFEPPSFSLGFDFDLLDSDTTPENNNDKAPASSNHFSAAGTTVEDDVDLETLTVVDSDSDNQESFPKLKRLRRGSTVRETAAAIKSKVDLCTAVVVDDDEDEEIDDFSSHEDEHLSTHHHSIHNSSKISLKGHGVLTKQSGKRKQNTLNDPESVLTNCNKPPFPKPTVSPLRKFQLLDSDSDSDDPFSSEHPTNNRSESHCNTGSPDFSLNEQIKLKESVSKPTQKDLWEDFKPEKSLHVPTPAFDAFCVEHFSSMKDKSKSQSNSNNQNNNRNVHVTNNVIDLDDTRPPAHQYFFHMDPRIQNLVRARLPNFFPLDAANRDSEEAGTSNIDYMGQFSNGEKSKRAARTIANKGETSAGKNSRKSKSQEMSRGFVNPNTQKGVPKDAGKRRVQADGQTSGQTAGVGHWFTNQDGKRVYVSKNGQELMGRPAYMLYKKERGGGFKNKKAKKSSTKKK